MDKKMEIKIIEANFDTVIPACVMEAIADSDDAKVQRAEEARVAAIESNILKSGIIRKINETLREHGRVGILLAQDDNHVGDWYWKWDSRSWLKHDIIKNVHNEELFNYIIDAYRKAGYRIGGYGTYSDNYWKDEERIIYAMADCDNCEV
jgi:hypothetical protein